MRLPYVLPLLVTFTSSLGLANASKRVAIIDGYIDRQAAKANNLTFCKLSDTLIDEIGIIKGFSYNHGTNIALTALDSVKDTCVLSYPVFKDTDKGQVIPNGSREPFSKAIRQAVLDGATHINYSVSGVQILPSERLAMLYALVHGVTLTVAVGNDNTVLQKGCYDRPSCYATLESFKPFIDKGTFNVIGNWSDSSNKVSAMKFMPFCSDKYVRLCGSSQSAALYTNKLLKGE